MHTPTGLFLHGGYGQQTVNLASAPAGVDDTSSTWNIQSGIETKLTALGKTTFFGEYRQDDVGVSRRALSSELQFYALGVVQKIDSAAIDFYTVYRHSTGEVTGLSGGPAGTTDLDDFDMIVSGARIQFSSFEGCTYSLGGRVNRPPILVRDGSSRHHEFRLNHVSTRYSCP